MRVDIIIGTLAALLSVISFVPQAWRIIRTRETKGISPRTYALTASAFGLWLVYGVMKSEWPLIVPNALCLVLALFILAMLVLPARQKDSLADAIDPAVSSSSPQSDAATH